MSGKISIMKTGNNMVLTPKDSLTYRECEDLENLFGTIMNQNPGAVVLNLKSVEYMDSAALELLLKMHAALKKSGSRLKLIELNQVCRDILLSTRLINVFHAYQTMQEALKSDL